MAKKKATRKTPAKKAKPKAVGTKKAKATIRPSAAKTPTKKRKPLPKPAAKSARPPRTPAAVRAPAPDARPGEPLGRPLVTAEEKLYMLFKEDYESRQIFEFLRVYTVGELEQYSPQQIIHTLSTPIRRTVERIRRKLAENKRHLRDDADFARQHLSAKSG